MRTRTFPVAAAVTLLLGTFSACASPSEAPPVTQPTTRPTTRPLAATGAAQREFFFTYEATVTGLAPKQVARVWLPVPPSVDDQQATIDRWTVPDEHAIGIEPKYLNHVFYARAPAGPDGTVAISITYRVTRREVTGDTTTAAPSMRPGPKGALGNGPNPDANPLLLPDAHVPVGGKSLKLLRGRKLSNDRVARARVLYD